MLAVFSAFYLICEKVGHAVGIGRKHAIADQEQHALHGYLFNHLLLEVMT